MFKNKSKFILKDYKYSHEILWHVNMQEWEEYLNRVFQKIMNAIHNKKELPVLRLGDGEYQFLFGKNEFNIRKSFTHLIKDLSIQYCQYFIRGHLIAKSATYESGTYSRSEIKKARMLFRSEYFRML